MPATPPPPPLAERMRPKSIDAYIGQSHLLQPGAPLRAALEGGFLPSMILWGPPGVGKTTLAGLLAAAAHAHLESLSAISSGVKELRAALDNARAYRALGTPTVLFIDEIHRFNKAQQDALLGAVEQGLVTLIGATTENPGFEVISALLSRCQVYVLEPLNRDELMFMARQALATDEVLSKLNIRLQEPEALLDFADGDGRRLLNTLELLATQANGADELNITNALTTRVIQKPGARYDKAGEMHYDIISAFIKSIRGSDPNAAVYYMARMLEGGEPPEFIARRMLILASEDIGNANPNALLLATSTMQAVSMIGMPESRIILSQCATYLAASAKSNAAYAAINKAQEMVRKSGNLPVPTHLRNAANSLLKDMNYGKDYAYSHDYEGNFSAQEYLPDAIKGTRIYEPGQNAREEELRKSLRAKWKSKYGY